jgi:uncharacterized protein with ParB-like and HNH nuclease domain
MKGSETKMLMFMEGANNRYVIPVYQRKYDWKIENCKQLYEDLRKIVLFNRPSHFFGSIVSSVVPNGPKIEYHIIDGQQRLTTVSLLLLAMHNLIKTNKIACDNPTLSEQIYESYLISKWAKPEDRIKLKSVKADLPALEALYSSEEDHIKGSNLTINYSFFCDMLLRQDVPVEQLFEAIGKLEIISITLDYGDNAQLIFESLNSTGLALQEGDKIRNYMLMGLTPKDQEEYYNNFWARIERNTRNDVSSFVRDYLSIKQLMTPNIDHVYTAFKKYVEGQNLPANLVFEDLLEYSRFYEKLLSCKSALHSQQLDDCLYRMKRLEIVVTRPFFMEVLRLNKADKLAVQEVVSVFRIIENYLFRRNICEVPTNALNKIFLNLNKEIVRYDNSTANYVDKLIYALKSKKESGRFPDDEEFAQELATKQVYLMRGKYKAYMFERFENYGTVETKDVYTHLDNNVYSIEHIMPQNPNNTWVQELGEDAETIHSTWLHRLANLTLTGYNSNLSNSPFSDKRDAPVYGYKASGIRMNQKIAQKASWGLPELEERSKEMVDLALQIWDFPKTAFQPAEKEYDSFALDDEDANFTGRDLVKYSFQNVEQPVQSWADMLEHIIKYLHQQDKSVLSAIAYNGGEANDLAVYVSTTEKGLRSAIKVDDDLYFEKGTSTASKINTLRRLFALYGVDPMDLVFYLRDQSSEAEATEQRHMLRKEYWEYALPLIQKANSVATKSFSNTKPGTSNTVSGWFGISGFCIQCVANFDGAYVLFYMGSTNTQKNKLAFDILFSHKSEIEAKLGTTLRWDRAEEKKSAWVFYETKDVQITNKADWERMAAFHCEWSVKLLGALLPCLKANPEIAGEQAEEDSAKSEKIAETLRKWASMKKEITLCPGSCSKSYTRFTTPTMSKILPDLENAPSGWNTPNHYFYEIRNIKGNAIKLQLAFSSRNMSEEQKALCEFINKYYPSRKHTNENWQWRIPFSVNKMIIGEIVSEEAIFAYLDDSFEKVAAFEKDLSKLLHNNSED